MTRRPTRSNDNTAGVRFWLGHRGFDPSLIEQGDSTDANENAKRLKVLGDWRGYRRNMYLFAGFPSDVEWNRAALTPEELARRDAAAQTRQMLLLTWAIAIFTAVVTAATNLSLAVA